MISRPGRVEAEPRSRGRWWALAVAVLSAAPGLLPSTVAAQGTATRVIVRAVASDAKLIGDGVGGARITVVDARTGELLARGVQAGSTGSTRRIMVEPRERGEKVYDAEGAAGFLAELALEEPTLVRIEAEGPLGTPHATQRASRTMLLVPGRDVLGDGVVLTLYGFTVELLEPTSDPSESAGERIPVRARVTMLCGCPTEPGGMWDSDDYTIEARIVDGEGTVLEKAPLTYAGATSTYRARIRVPSGEGLSLQVLAMDPGKANFGQVRLRFDEIGAGQSSER
ncbi:MAG: hypothetical protein GWM92_01595 [Gemmatimonadetes bacterium]|nr:hypothetical protein [Gemmatimonadota bacterium]NIR77172.1 hypothetical protein [Gemmatimonadota bacterium]NIT85689.1 hypothetical protein [Gemmatimonadota bacterium]NIU29518.1 hypothetical protein [Gemmatimonadota bacterium]NIU34565.1 hypothetical protein [Gemmatimonadota bacterium]